jgi:hypothetical protein
VETSRSPPKLFTKQCPENHKSGVSTTRGPLLTWEQCSLRKTIDWWTIQCQQQRDPLLPFALKGLPSLRGWLPDRRCWALLLNTRWEWWNPSEDPHL